MKNKKILGLMFTFLFISLFCLVNVKAYSQQKMKGGEKVCLETNIFSQANLYTWRSGYEGSGWPGKTMTKENNIFCYTLSSDEEEKYEHDSVIFNDGSKQTKDLSYLGSGLIYVLNNDMVEKEGNNYVGKWYVYDKSGLVNLVNETASYKATDYTIASYNSFLTYFNTANTISNESYKVDGKLNENYLLKDKTGGGYFSAYKVAYDNLLNFKNKLVLRKIKIDSATGGSVSYQYEENSNTKMNIISTADAGYELSSLIISNDSGVLKDFSHEILNSEPFTYEYNDENLVITPSYKLKQFVINFTVGKDGKIYDLEDGKNEEITSPVTVEYGKNKTLTIIANPGFDVNTVTVDGADYELDGGKVEIKNVQNDVNVEVSFKLKNYTITIDGTNHTVSHGSTYDYLLSLFTNEKEGYNFIGLKNANGDKVESDYIVTGNAVFTTDYEKKEYRISFVVGENGKIQNNNNPIASPVTVLYEDDYTFKVVANEGFEVDAVKVDGIKYELTNDEVKIENVKKDVNVEVSFKLKEYKIKVDGNEYNVAYNTSYSELLDIISPEKKGFNFIGLEDKNGNLISSTYVVKGNDELTTKYERKNYKITLIVGKDGKVYDSSNNEITSPITVSYEDDYTLKVVANEGYDVKEVTVDGVSYKLIDGQVEIKNVQKDVEVKVDFKLKSHKVTVDGEVYNIVHGTSYEELLKQIKITKKGYVFKGIKNSNGEMLDENYVVNDSDKLEIIYEKDPVVQVPSTGDSIIGYVMIFVSALIALSVFFITRKKKCKN